MDYSVWRIIGTIICGLFIAWEIAALVLTRLKAVKLGVVYVKYPTSLGWFAGAVLLTVLMWASFAYFTAEYKNNRDYLEDMETRGITAIAERQGKSVGELLDNEELVGS